MGLEELWNEAIRETEIVSLPIKRLLTFDITQFEYVCLAPSVVNKGDTVIRKGRMNVDKPNLILPKSAPQFEGFSDEHDATMKDDALSSFFYLRGISFPSLKYTNEHYTLDIYEGALAGAVKKYQNEIRMREAVSTGLLIGADASWQFSLILLACAMIDNHVDNDLRMILDRIRRRSGRE